MKTKRESLLIDARQAEASANAWRVQASLLSYADPRLSDFENKARAYESKALGLRAQAALLGRD